jgi:hypothetical protein
MPDGPRHEGHTAGGLEIPVPIPATQQRIEGMRTEVVRVPGTTDAYAYWVLYTKLELDALPEDAREERLLGQLQFGHVGTAFALTLLAEYPTPRVAVAIFEKMEQRDFTTQMPKPGFHKELKEDRRAHGGARPLSGARTALLEEHRAAKGRLRKRGLSDAAYQGRAANVCLAPELGPAARSVAVSTAPCGRGGEARGGGEANADAN